MPIYAYRCSSCGRAKDVLQRMSDPVLSECPFCGEATFVKQVTAAGFQLKGSGWYVTDFRGDSKAPKAVDGESSADASKADAKADGKAEAKGADGKGADGKGAEGKASDGKSVDTPAGGSTASGAKGNSASATPSAASAPAASAPAPGGGPASK